MLSDINIVATAPTVYGIETRLLFRIVVTHRDRCNSPYRLRY